MAEAELANLETAARGITSPIGIIVACSIILLSAAVVFIRFWWITRPPIAELKIGRKRLQSIADETEFASEFEDLDSWAGSRRWIGHLWQEFTETLILPGQSDRQVVRNIAPAESFFSEDKLLERYNLRFYQGFQNYLTGAGILGTFIGLVAGIYLAEAGLDSNDVDETRRALSHLLHGASLAFLTSIAGLASSILFSFFEKVRHHSLRDLISGWNHLLDERLQLVTLEEVGLDSLKEAKNQTTELRRFNTDLAVSIAGALDEKMAERVAPAFERLIEAVDLLRADRSTDSQKVLEQVVTRFEHALSGNTKTELNGLATTVSDVSKGFNEAALNLTQGQAQSTRELQRMASTMSEFMEQSHLQSETERRQSHEQFSRHLADLSSQMDSVVHRLDEAATSASESLVSGARDSTTLMRQSLSQGASHLLTSMDTLNSLNEKLQGSFTHLNNLSATLGRTHDGMSDTAAGLSSAAVGLQNLMPSLRNGLSQMAELAGSGEALLATVRSEHEALRQTLHDYESRFKDVDAHTQRLFDAINSHVETYSKSILEYSKDMQTEMGEAVRQLSGAINELGETFEDLPRLTS